MLAPSDIEALGRELAEAYRGPERSVMMMLLGQVESAVRRGHEYEALRTDGMAVQRRAQLIMASYRKALRRAATHEVVAALATSDERDAARLGGLLGDLPADVSATLSASADSTVAEVLRMVDRASVLVGADARDTYTEVMSRYLSVHMAGGLPGEESYRRAVQELASRGVRTLTRDRDGRKVRTHVDVAVATEMRTAISSAAIRRTLSLCRELGVDLVEVTSHIGARPSHRMWQGRVYSISGTDPDHPSLAEGTGISGTGPYGALGDRLGGVNCRHGLGPYLAGADRAYSEDPDADEGLDGEEVYRDTQRQRALERQMRDASRQVAAATTPDDKARAEARAKAIDARLDALVDAKGYLHRAPSREDVHDALT